MTFEQAITILATTGSFNGSAESDEARSLVARTVRGLVRTVRFEDSFGDWIANGSFSGNETPESIAAEWDAQQ